MPWGCNRLNTGCGRAYSPSMPQTSDQFAWQPRVTGKKMGRVNEGRVTHSRYLPGYAACARNLHVIARLGSARLARMGDIENAKHVALRILPSHHHLL